MQITVQKGLVVKKDGSLYRANIVQITTHSLVSLREMDHFSAKLKLGFLRRNIVSRRKSEDEEVFRVVSAGSTHFRPPVRFHVIHDPNVTGKEGSALLGTQIITTSPQI